MERVQREIQKAPPLCPPQVAAIDVTRRSIEETAASILQMPAPVDSVAAQQVNREVDMVKKVLRRPEQSDRGSSRGPCQAAP
jgi:hypothetical protein